MQDFEIKPLEGIGDISFGMRSTEVRRILGDPEKSVIDIRENRSGFSAGRLQYNRKWAYPSLGIVLSFTAPHELAGALLLRSITIEDPRATLDGEPLLGISEQAFLAAIARSRIGSVELLTTLQPMEWASPDCDIREYVSESDRITFWIENGTVTSINLWDEWRTTPYLKFKTTVKMGPVDVEKEH